MKYIPTGKGELYRLFHEALIPESIDSFRSKIKQIYFEKVPEIEEIEDGLCKSLEDKINCGLPTFTKKMKRKKGFQITAKVLIGIAAGIPIVALIGTGVGAAAGAIAGAATSGALGAGVASTATTVGTILSGGSVGAGALTATTSVTIVTTTTSGLSTVATGCALGAGIGAGVGAVSGGITGGLIEPKKEMK